MPVPLVTTPIREQPRVAGDIITTNLPVNPMSFMLLTLQVTAAMLSPTLDQLLAAWARIEVLFKGTSIVSLNGLDLARLVMRLWRQQLPAIQFNAVAPNLIRLTLPIPFSRVPWWMDEGFPATRSGELQLRVTYAGAFVNFTLPVETLTTVEILDMNPTRFLKYTTISDAAVAIGDRAQIDLPIGNPILGLLLRSTTVPGAAMTSTIRRLKLLVDNVEYAYNQVERDPLMFLGLIGMDYPSEYNPNATDFNNYLYLQFDPFTDGSYALRTEGRARIMLEFRADAADNVRVIPVELINLAAGA